MFVLLTARLDASSHSHAETKQKGREEKCTKNGQSPGSSEKRKKIETKREPTPKPPKIRLPKSKT